MKIQNCVQFLQKNKFKIALVAGGIIALFVAVHLVLHRGTNRRVFVFPVSASTKTETEVRYLPKDAVQGRLQCYIDELLLGPVFYRGRPLFTLGTKLDYCFVTDRTLYVGLSENAVLQENGALELEKALVFFKKNIKKNFTRIKKIEVFIDGNYISD